jgi:recombination protein RecR
VRNFPAPIRNAASALGKLPGVGPKTALRYAFAVLHFTKHDIASFAKALAELANVQTCESCFAFSEGAVCEICRNTQRNKHQLCVVAESRDVATMEATAAFTGKYFVLGGTLNPVDGRTPETLNIKELLKRIESSSEIKEIILAFSPDVHGETTIMYLSRILKPFQRKVTRLARGLPMGADIEYADEVTLLSALQGRSET